MAAGNEAQRSDRIERGMIRSLHFVVLPAAIFCFAHINNAAPVASMDVFCTRMPVTV